MNSKPLIQLPPQRSRRGIALVITLLLLVLLSAFAVAFFTRMSVEQASATSYADGVTTRQLADSAVGLVESQVREATTVLNGAWASQPGMIRTFANSSGTGTTAGPNPYGYYKLYSSDNMTITEPTKLEQFDPIDEIDPNWAKERALWVDLNDPVRLTLADPADETKTTVVKRYPIFDPGLAAASDMTSPSGLSMHNTTSAVKVEGYTIDSDDSTTENNRGRMPVRWIYVLRDGTLTAPTGSEDDGLKAVWKGGGDKVPTKANPIVGRVAFWTDDDTSKVNVNTAGGFTTKDVDRLYDPKGNKTFDLYAGSFWDTPRFYTAFERGGATLDNLKFGEPVPDASGGKGGNYSLALAQPPANEFQRFPGHPATTSLGLVFNRTINLDGSVDPTTPRLSSQQLYRLLPRLTAGGTEGGTDRLLATNRARGTYDLSDSMLPLKAQRLYATIDEFFFAATQVGTQRQTLNDFLKTVEPADPDAGRRREIPGMTVDLIAKQDLDEFQGYRFLLTAHNRAPELNLFGRPRVSIWPVWASGKQGTGGVDYSVRRNPIERLMVFTSTLGPLPKPDASGAQSEGKLFAFQRWNPYDPYADGNIPRNTFLLKNYLTGSGTSPGLTEQAIPGFTTGTTSFASKYNGADGTGNRDQILTEIFDYIRAGVNLRDTYYDREIIPAGESYEAANISTATRNKLDPTRYAPRGIVIPAAVTYPTSRVAASRGKEIAGFGRFPSVSEVAVVFYHAGYVGSREDDNGNATDHVYWDPREKRQYGVKAHLMRFFVMVETFNPMQGYSRTEDTSQDDRNKAPDRLTHILDVSLPPSVTLTQQPDRPTHQFTFDGGLLTNEVQFQSGSFSGGNNAAGMEGTLHTFGRKFDEPSRGLQYIPPDPLNKTNGRPNYTPPGAGVYPFQSLNVVRVPVLNAGAPIEDVNDPDQRTQELCRFNGFKATLRVRFGPRELQFVNLDFPAADIPLPTDAYWEDPGGFGWINPDVRAWNGSAIVSAPSSFNPSFGSSNSTNTAWPWACWLLDHPAAMKSLAHRIWWINEVWPLSGRAYSGQFAKFDTVTGQELVGENRGYRFDRRWRNIIQPGDVVRSVVPAPAGSTDLRTVALTRFKNNETVAYEPLRPTGPNSGYFNPYVRHVQRIAIPGQARPGELADNTKPGEQAQLLRNGDGTPFIYSGSAAANLTTFNSGSGFAIEPYVVREGDEMKHYWLRRTYGTINNGTTGAIGFGNLAELSAGKLGAYGTRAGELPARQDNSDVNGVRLNGVNSSSAPLGDFDTGYGDRPDGSLCNKPDEGQLIWRTDKTSDDHVGDPGLSSDWDYQYPYFTGFYREETSETFFSPNRQIPSAVHFGSLLVGSKTGWKTLCFSPNPAALTSATPKGKANHPGMDIEPKDHLLLDLFQMPVVEPYAITEPFSTAGKVNLNCEIIPFSYIRRTTALRAALHSVRVTAVNSADISGRGGIQVSKYKSVAAYNEGQNYRLLLNRDETIKGITSIFSDTSLSAKDRFYKSASQICERFLYPDKWNYYSGEAGPKWNRNESDIRRFWDESKLGGDNTREKPYADLYPRLTTKSNTYTVHVRVQKLRPQKGREDEDFLTWTEAEDVVAAEYRGEVQIERYLDPQDRRFDLNDTTVPADDRFNVDATRYNTNQPATRPLEHAYRFRVVNSKRFAPTR